MDKLEIFSNIVIGIISGIISSVLVTIFYRIIDREKDRQKYFADLRLYMSKLISIPHDDINSIYNFMCNNELPHTFKWIHLKNDEWEIITQINEDVNEYTQLILQFEEKKLSLLEKNEYNDQSDNQILMELLPKLQTLKVILTQRKVELTYLGNKYLNKIHSKESNSNSEN